MSISDSTSCGCCVGNFSSISANRSSMTMSISLFILRKATLFFCSSLNFFALRSSLLWDVCRLLYISKYFCNNHTMTASRPTITIKNKAKAIILHCFVFSSNSSPFEDCPNDNNHRNKPDDERCEDDKKREQSGKCSPKGAFYCVRIF